MTTVNQYSKLVNLCSSFQPSSNVTQLFGHLKNLNRNGMQMWFREKINKTWFKNFTFGSPSFKLKPLEPIQWRILLWELKAVGVRVAHVVFLFSQFILSASFLLFFQRRVKRQLRQKYNSYLNDSSCSYEESIKFLFFNKDFCNFLRLSFLKKK